MKVSRELFHDKNNLEGISKIKFSLAKIFFSNVTQKVFHISIHIESYDNCYFYLASE